jgi:hypothetical protein
MTTSEVAKQKSESPSVPVLAALWQARVKMIFNAEKNPTHREFGQLKMLRDRLGDTATEAIHWALNNWSRFSNEAKARTGLPSAPPAPHIGFLLAHYDVALSLMYAIAKSTTVKSATDLRFIGKIEQMAAELPQQLQEEISAAAKAQAEEIEKATKAAELQKPKEAPPMRLQFTQQQCALMFHPDHGEEFIAKIKAKYGEFILGQGGPNWARLPFTWLH